MFTSTITNIVTIAIMIEITTIFKRQSLIIVAGITDRPGTSSWRWCWSWQRSYVWNNKWWVHQRIAAYACKWHDSMSYQPGKNLNKDFHLKGKVRSSNINSSGFIVIWLIKAYSWKAMQASLAKRFSQMARGNSHHSFFFFQFVQNTKKKTPMANSIYEGLQRIIVVLFIKTWQILSPR